MSFLFNCSSTHTSCYILLRCTTANTRNKKIKHSNWKNCHTTHSSQLKSVMHALVILILMILFLKMPPNESSIYLSVVNAFWCYEPLQLFWNFFCTFWFTTSKSTYKHWCVYVYFCVNSFLRMFLWKEKWNHAEYSFVWGLINVLHNFGCLYSVSKVQEKVHWPIFSFLEILHIEKSYFRKWISNMVHYIWT